MPIWIFYLCIFFLGAVSNLLIAYCCNMENHCLPTSATIALGITLGLAVTLGYIHGKLEE